MKSYSFKNNGKNIYVFLKIILKLNKYTAVLVILLRNQSCQNTGISGLVGQIKQLFKCFMYIFLGFFWTTKLSMYIVLQRRSMFSCMYSLFSICFSPVYEPCLPLIYTHLVFEVYCIKPHTSKCL